MNKLEVLHNMSLCKQSENQTVLEHGLSVKKYFDELISNPINFKLPDWFVNNKSKILENIHEDVHEYLELHDCGKPYCRVIDADGKQHFPNHAEVSKNIYLGFSDNQIVANLIGWDMIIHTSSSEEIKEWCEIWNIKDACTLLLASLAELHSNAEMFGGKDTISFKTKYKNLDRRGKQITKHYFT